MNNTCLLLRNSVFLLITALMGRASTSVAFVFIARILGPAESGVYALAVAFAVIGASVVYWGLDQVIARDVARNYASASQYVANFLVMRAVLSIGTLLTIALITRWPFNYDRHITTVIILISLAILPDALDDVWQSLFIAFERMNIPTLTSVVTGVLRLLTMYAVLALGGTLETVALVVITTSLLRLGMDTALGLRCLGVRLGPLSVSFSLRHLQEALPFLFVNLCITLGTQADTVLLSLFLSEYDVGLYRSTLTIVTAVALIPEAYRVAVLPTLSRLYHRSSAAFVQMYRRSSFYLLLLVLPISASLIALAEPVQRLVYGVAFIPGADVLRILSLGLPFTFLVVPNARVLVAAHRQDIAARAQGLSTLVGLLLALTLVPPARVIGAATARVVAATVLFLFCYLHVYKHVSRFDILCSAWRPLLVVALMTTVLVFVGPQAPLLVSLITGAAIYLGGLVVLRVLPEEDWQQFWRLLHIPGD